MCRNAHDFFVVSDTLITFMACNINDKLMTVTDRFLKYVTFDTESSETTGVTPSTPGSVGERVGRDRIGRHHPR